MPTHTAPWPIVARTGEKKQRPICSLMQKLQWHGVRQPWPRWMEQGSRQIPRLQPCFPKCGCSLCMMAWPTGHHKPPCRAHPIHTENTNQEIIYRPELYRNHCVCCCCGNGDVEQALGLQRRRRPGKAVDFHPGSPGSHTLSGVTQE